jgi:hypothetical protein
MPVAKHGLLYLGAGYHYGPLFAIRPGASGDISIKPGAKNDWIAWHEPKGAGIHPSFLISGDRLYSVFDAGFLTCHDAKTGKIHYNRQRLPSEPGRFYASPWSYNGKVFLLNEDGTTYVIEDVQAAPHLRAGRAGLGDAGHCPGQLVSANVFEAVPA